MKIEGGCHCGQIEYRAEIDPEQVEICHCTDCQILSGAPYRAVVPAKDGSFELVRGQMKNYIKVSEDGTDRVQAFCPECGTPIHSGPVKGESGFFGIRVGSIRQRDQLIPKEQIWVRSAQSWTQNLSVIPQLEKE